MLPARLRKPRSPARSRYTRVRYQVDVLTSTEDRTNSAVTGTPCVASTQRTCPFEPSRQHHPRAYNAAMRIRQATSVPGRQRQPRIAHRC